jgi:hypothetical protein
VNVGEGTNAGETRLDCIIWNSCYEYQHQERTLPVSIWVARRF